MILKKHIDFKGTKVHYSVRGEGNCIMLLHGYLENSDIWEGFIPLLESGHRIVVPDLPGHGRSGTWGEAHAMEDLAEALLAVAEAEDIDRMLLVGHSMGGYVCMAFAEACPERLAGYVLFHSTCFADSGEKRQNREREISLVRCGKLGQIVNVNIPRAFADEHVDSMAARVEEARQVALSNDPEGIIALLNGMKNRKDRSAVLADPSLPLMLVRGERDNYIPGEVMDRLEDLAPHARVFRMEHSGHMGFVEEPARAAAALVDFAASCFRD